MHPITHRNLERAMREEGFAFARYMLYGRSARAHGHSELADIFESMADAEVFDYFMHEAELSGFGSRSDIDNLHDAISAEARAAEDMYHGFEQQARDAGDAGAAEQFSHIRADKQRRRTRLTATLDALDASTPQPHRILVVANESCQGSGLCDEIKYRSGRVPSRVFIVAPALTKSRLHYLASDLDQETAQATDRLETLRGELERSGVPATGRVGDTDPLVAIEDALREFPTDEIVIATHPPDQSTWLERDVVHEARKRFAPLLVTHVVVDPIYDRGAALTGD
jgi:rubrerythrin